MVGVVAGVLTVFMSLMGCFAALLQSRPLLCCYLCVFTTVWSIQVAAAAITFSYSQQLNVKAGAVPSGSLTAYSDIQINNAVFSVYQRCCTGCPPNVYPCNNPFPDTYVNSTLAFCQSPSTCTYVVPCASASSGQCFKYAGSAPVVVPPYSPDGTVCSVLQSLSTTNPSGNTVKLVDYAVNGGCGAGNPTVFLQNMANYLSTHLTGVFVLFILIIVFEGVALPFGFYLALTGGTRGSRTDPTFLGTGEEGIADDSSALHDGKRREGGGDGIAMA